MKIDIGGYEYEADEGVIEHIRLLEEENDGYARRAIDYCKRLAEMEQEIADEWDCTAGDGIE